jgi:hypothetical protein
MIESGRPLERILAVQHELIRTRFCASRLLAMDFHAESESLLVLALVILVFLFLSISERRSLSQRQQAGLSITLTIVFFSVCNLLFSGNSRIASGPK